MKRFLMTGLYLLAISILLSAQTPSTSAPKPPILRHMPAFASWTITYLYKSQPTLDLPQSLTVTKTDKTYREVTVLLSGKQSERWIYNGTVLERPAGSTSIVPVPPPSVLNPEPDYPNYSRGDFKDLDWLSMQTYQGIQSNAGKPAFAFATGNGPTQSTALLSAPDQWPLIITDGGITSIYTYNVAPTEPQTLPPNFMQVLKLHQKGQAALQYHASPP